MYWRGFARKFVPYRRAASGTPRIPWGRGAEGDPEGLLGDRWPMEIMAILARKSWPKIRAKHANT